MSTENTAVEQQTKRTRTPRNAETITKGASELPLNEKIELVKTLKGQIAAEVGDLKALAEQAIKSSDGL